MVVQGHDLDVNYTEKLGPGVLALGLQGTYYTSSTRATPGAAPSSEKVGTTVNGCGNPVVSSTAAWMATGWCFATSSTPRQLDAGRLGDDAGQQLRTRLPHRLGPEWQPDSQDAMSLWDLQVACSGIKGAVLTLGARNIFDTQPPSTYVPSRTSSRRATTRSQYDPRGRFVYLTGTFKF